MVAFQHAVNVISIMLCVSICVKQNNHDPLSVSESACPYLIRKEGIDSLAKVGLIKVTPVHLKIPDCFQNENFVAKHRRLN